MKRLVNHPLLWIFLLGLALRVGAAFVSTGYDHPNEIYRLFEPMAALQGYTAWPPWEWTDGLLSALPVRAHLFVIQGLALLGLTEPDAQAIALRVLYACLGSLLIPAAWSAVSMASRSAKAEGRPGSAPSVSAAALGAALFVALWPEFIYQSVRLMDYSLEAAALALCMLCLSQRERHPRLITAGIGALLGSLFFVRYQSGLHLLSFGAVLAWLGWEKEKQTFYRLPLFLAGAYGLTILALAGVESRGGGSLLQPFWNYWRFNWVENGAARMYGEAPWHRYLSESLKYYGFTALASLLALSLGGREHRRASAKLLVLWAFPILIHSLIAHKEGRFIYGSLWLLVPAGFSGWTAPAGVRFRRVAALALVLGFVPSALRVSAKVPAGREAVRVFAQTGRVLQQWDPDRKIALLVVNDPVQSPGAFFLRQHGPLCYHSWRNLGRELGPDSEQCQPLPSTRFNLERSTGLPVPTPGEVWRSEGWTLRKVQ